MSESRDEVKRVLRGHPNQNMIYISNGKACLPVGMEALENAAKRVVSLPSTPAKYFMKIFLTSSADRVLEKLLPSISETPSEMKVAFIPTAGDLYSDKPWQERDRDKLKELGFQVEDVDLKITQHESLEQKLSEVDIIFVAGGNTSYLLEKAQESGLLEIARNLVHSGTIYIGSSAGSLLAGPNIEMDTVYDDGEFGKVLASYEGLGLVDFVVLPHANKEEYRPYIDKIKAEYGQKYSLVELDDNQALMVLDGKRGLLEVSK